MDLENKMNDMLRQACNIPNNIESKIICLKIKFKVGIH